MAIQSNCQIADIQVIIRYVDANLVELRIEWPIGESEVATMFPDRNLGPAPHRSTFAGKLR